MIDTKDIADFVPSGDLTIWDVRDVASFNDGHIAYAKSVPLDSITPELLDQTVGKIYVLCGGGTKAVKACELLEKLDPNRTYVHLTGGTRGAKALGWVLVTEN